MAKKKDKTVDTLNYLPRIVGKKNSNRVIKQNSTNDKLQEISDKK